MSNVSSLCRYRGDHVQPSPWSNPDWARPALLAHNAYVEESCIYAAHVPHQVSNRRGTDHHLLRCGGKSAESEWTLLQVSHWADVRQAASVQVHQGWAQGQKLAAHLLLCLWYFILLLNYSITTGLLCCNSIKSESFRNIYYNMFIQYNIRGAVFCPLGGNESNTTIQQ